jgi:two-component system OmpR family response regulator
MRVLVIEDDQQTRDYLVRGLSESGHTVEAAADGKEGLFLALEQDFDVLVIDRMLPGLDGLAIVDAVRSEGRRTRILILSALGEVDDRVEGLKRGGDDYLVKPFAFSVARRSGSPSPMCCSSQEGVWSPMGI